MDKSNENLTGKSFIKKLIGFSVASWITAGISFLSTPIITRLFLPEEVGKINMFVTLLVMFQTISILGLDQGFMRFYNNAPEGFKKNTLFSFCLSISLFMASFCSILVFLFNDFFSKQVSGYSNGIVPICLIITIFSSVILRMTSVSSRMEKKVVSYTLQTVFISIVEKIFFVVIAFYKPSHLYAIITMTIGYFVLALTMLFIKKKKLLKFDFYIPKESILLILKFSIPYLPVLLLSWLNNSIPQFVLKEYVDYSAIGLYSNAVTIANILTILQAGFNIYWVPLAYENYKNNKDKLIKIHRIMTFLLISFALCIIFFQDYIYLLLGERFRSGKLFFPFLILTPICNSIADATGIGIMISKKSYKNIYTFITNTSINFLLCFILIPKIGVAGGAIAAGMSALSMLVVRTYIGSKYYKLNDNYWYLFLSILALVVTAFINWSFQEFLIIRLLSCFFALILVIFIYRKEVKYLYLFVMNEYKHLRKN